MEATEYTELQVIEDHQEPEMEDLAQSRDDVRDFLSSFIQGGKHEEGSGSSALQEGIVLHEEVHSCMLEMEEMINNLRQEGIFDDKWVTKMEEEYDEQFGLALDSLFRMSTLR